MADQVTNEPIIITSEIPKPFDNPAGKLTELGPAAFRVDYGKTGFSYRPGELVSDQTYRPQGVDAVQLEKYQSGRNVLGETETAQIKAAIENVRQETITAGKAITETLFTQPAAVFAVESHPYDPNNLTNTSKLGGRMTDATPQEFAILALAKSMRDSGGRVQNLNEGLTETTVLRDAAHEGKVLAVKDETVDLAGGMKKDVRTLFTVDEATLPPMPQLQSR